MLHYNTHQFKQRGSCFNGYYHLHTQTWGCLCEMVLIHPNCTTQGQVQGQLLLPNAIMLLFLHHSRWDVRLFSFPPPQISSSLALEEITERQEVS